MIDYQTSAIKLGRGDGSVDAVVRLNAAIPVAMAYNTCENCDLVNAI